MEDEELNNGMGEKEKQKRLKNIISKSNGVIVEKVESGAFIDDWDGDLSKIPEEEKPKLRDEYDTI